MRYFSALALVCLLAGCVPPVEHHHEQPEVTRESSITRAAREAFETYHEVYAEELIRIADDLDGGSVKYDAKLKQLLDEARTKAENACNPKLAKLMSDEFGGNAVENPSRAANSLREFAKALK